MIYIDHGIRIILSIAMWAERDSQQAAVQLCFSQGNKHGIFLEVSEHYSFA